MELVLDEYSAIAYCVICGDPFDATVYNVHHAKYCPRHKHMSAWDSKIQQHNRRTQALGLPSTLTLLEWIGILEAHNYKCIYCGDPWQDIEHKIPVTKGGGTTRENCAPACHTCNQSKGNRAAPRKL
jgi:5-methylcytosine-specific restriction endonuclease McrA